MVFEFMPLSENDIAAALIRAGQKLAAEDYKDYAVAVSDGAVEHLARTAGGDVRKALNGLELCFLATAADKDGKIEITEQTAEEVTQKKNLRYDKDGDGHYDMMSALQKSIRGSDPNAAVYYLAKILAAGDMPAACRRLLVIASEDVGLAYPQAAVVTKACVDSALQLGMPEARIPLAHAAVLLATAPKSNSAYNAIAAAMYDIEHKDTGGVPRALQNVHCDGEGDVEKGQNYLYPHDYPNHYVKQQYLPDKIKDAVYYEYGENKMERASKEYWEKIKEK